MTVTVYLDWRDAYTAGVSVLLLLSFWLAYRARNIAKHDDRRSQWFMLWSGVLLFTGHSVFLIVGTLLSLEGFYIANVGFMLFATRAVVGMALQLRRRPVASVVDPAASNEPAAVPPSPPAHTNGHPLPLQRPMPTGSGPWPRPQLDPNAAALAVETTQTAALPPRPRDGG